MKTKKFFAVILTMFLVASMSACSGKEESPKETARAASETTAEKETETAEQTSQKAEFQEQVIVDNENFVFKITSAEDDGVWGYTWKAYLENKTDKELMFALNNVAVNGFMCDPFWATTVTAGMKANEEISWATDAFEKNGIEDVAKVEFQLTIYDNNDLMADYLLDEKYIVYPRGEEAFQQKEREAQESDIVLFDNDSCTMIITGFDPDNEWGYTMNAYLVNKTDKELMFASSDVAVNGFMCDPFWAESITAGNRSNVEISWMASDFEENGITEVESITLPMQVYNNRDFAEEALVEETFTVNPK